MQKVKQKTIAKPERLVVKSETEQLAELLNAGLQKCKNIKQEVLVEGSGVKKMSSKTRRRL